ncbi:ABC transporter permease [Saccharopolyspora gregorii]|uniref:ABC transporter permease n=1 Tax=Saccharopolyspora gregorii TaxID=33914 RepID=UPI0021ABFDD7|nr:FtsX-like permease family protein [Saccharopolyspora gregorii]
MSRIRTWTADLVLGARLAVGDRNTPWGRLALMTVGIGIGVLVLLISASLPTWLERHAERTAGRHMELTYETEPAASTAVLGLHDSTTFRGQRITGRLLQPQRPDAPLPAGLDHYPAVGELIVSPALADLLARPDSALLRERLPGTITGTIGDDGLLTPGELHYYGGASGLTEQAASIRVVDHFGETYRPPSYGESTWLLVLIGACALLLPVVVFVISTTRLAEAARQRRLAALRLVGASAWQVRRIASGEALVGASTGVLAGWALFLAGHLAFSRFETSFVSVFVSDITPVWWPAVLITAGVPALTVLISLAALRGAVHDPLRSVRQATPIRRRLWPGAAALVLGIAGLVVSRMPLGWDSNVWGALVVLAVALVLLSVPLLLPWIVENVARRGHAGPVAWQLALRRLQLTSGTAARSVSAIAVVVTGIIALQTMLASLEQQVAEHPSEPRTASISGREDRSGRDGLQQLRTELAALPGVVAVSGHHQITLQAGPDRSTYAVIADCDLITRLGMAPDCRDGDTFAASAGSDGEGEPPRTGETWTVGSPGGSSAETPGSGASWTVPPLRPTQPRNAERNMLTPAGLLITPAAATGIPLEPRNVDIRIELAATTPQDLVERIRNLVEATLEQGEVSDTVAAGPVVPTATLQLVKTGLLAGALVVFSLIGCSLLVTAVEQIHERARPMAVLGAVGAKRSTLVWSAFLQNAVPMLLATAIAVPAGYGLGVLIYVTDFAEIPALDLPGTAAVLAFAAVSVLVVTALTAPTLSKAMNSDGLHVE